MIHNLNNFIGTNIDLVYIMFKHHRLFIENKKGASVIPSSRLRIKLSLSFDTF